VLQPSILEHLLSWFNYAPPLTDPDSTATVLDILKRMVKVTSVIPHLLNLGGYGVLSNLMKDLDENSSKQVQSILTILRETKKDYPVKTEGLYFGPKIDQNLSEKSHEQDLDSPIFNITSVCKYEIKQSPFKGNKQKEN